MKSRLRERIANTRRLAVTAAVAASVAVAIAAPQTASTQDGVYSEAQAARGQAVYEKSCVSCHGKALEGDGQAPALADAEFAKEWNGQPLSDLFERIRLTMPGDAPGSLKPEETADVLAFVLKIGNHPSGAAELAADAAALKSITFTAMAPKALHPAFANP